VTYVLGLTGSIGMGKSTTAAMFREAGVAVHDADATVHALYRGVAAPLIEQAFPGTAKDGVVDRKALAAALVGDPQRLAQLETIVHPLVQKAEVDFLKAALAAHTPLVVLDIPLLFETGAERRCDAVVVATVAPAIQRARVLARPGMTAAIFDMIHVKQMADAEKRARAHFLVDSGRGIAAARHQISSILRALAGRPGRAAARAVEAAAGS
jgi:dephospho-CoA kinase